MWPPEPSGGRTDEHPIAGIAVARPMMDPTPRRLLARTFTIPERPVDRGVREARRIRSADLKRARRYVNDALIRAEGASGTPMLGLPWHRWDAGAAEQFCRDLRDRLELECIACTDETLSRNVRMPWRHVDDCVAWIRAVMARERTRTGGPGSEAGTSAPPRDTTT